MSCNPPTDRPVLCGKPRFVLAEAILLPPPLLLLRLVSSDLPPRLSKEGDGPERRGKWKGEDIPDNHTWASWRGKLAREIQSSTFSNLADGKLLSLHVFFCVFLLAEPTHIPLSMYAPPSRLTATSTVRNWVGRPTPKTHNTPLSPPPRKRGERRKASFSLRDLAFSFGGVSKETDLGAVCQSLNGRRQRREGGERKEP